MFRKRNPGSWHPYHTETLKKLFENFWIFLLTMLTCMLNIKLMSNRNVMEIHYMHDYSSYIIEVSSLEQKFHLILFSSRWKLITFRKWNQIIDDTHVLWGTSPYLQWCLTSLFIITKFSCLMDHLAESFTP